MPRAAALGAVANADPRAQAEEERSEGDQANEEGGHRSAGQR
jgi:hypothetical protein